MVLDDDGRVGESGRSIIARSVGVHLSNENRTMQDLVEARWPMIYMRASSVRFGHLAVHEWYTRVIPFNVRFMSV